MSIVRPVVQRLLLLICLSTLALPAVASGLRVGFAEVPITPNA